MIHAERGYLIPAINSDTVDYVACAERLAHSIRAWHPDADITILTRDLLPFPSRGGYADDWQVFWASPYRETIKLEADMLAVSPVDHWWTLFQHRDVVISQGSRDFRDCVNRSRHYRKIFDQNNLPDVYNGITYWRLSHTAKMFFTIVRDIFDQWPHWRSLLRFPENEPSTDVVYAMAAVVIGIDQVTLPPSLGPTMIHMKRHVYGGQTEDWTKELIWERAGSKLSIQTLRQWGFFHYHIKSWSPDE